MHDTQVCERCTHSTVCTRTAATVQVADAKLVAAGIKPGKNGVFGRVQGRSLKIDSAPREKSGEWVLDLVEIPG